MKLFNFFKSNKSKLSEIVNQVSPATINDLKVVEPIQISPEQINKDEIAILSVLVSSTGNMTPPEVAKVKGWEASKAFRRMSKMREKNLVKVEEKRKCKIHGTTCMAYSILI